MRNVPRSAYPGVFFLALSVILLQIALTRVYAIMMWHHLTYMVVSIALLGFGAAGSILTVQRNSGRSTSARMALYSCGYGLSALLAFGLSPLVPIDSLRLWQEKSNFLSLLLLYLIAALPFLLAGMALGLALTKFVHRVNRLYFVDLVGSGLGGAASVVLLTNFGGSNTVVVAATLGLVAAFLFSLAEPRRLLAYTAPALGVGLLASLLFTGAGQILGLPHWQWHPPFASGKQFAAIERGGAPIERLFSATAEVEVGPEFESVPGLGGDMGTSVTTPIPLRLVGQDGTAPTLLLRDAGDLQQMPFLRTTQAASAYVAGESLGASERDVMVIGVGGGVDVMIALLSGARRVTAVELNTAMVEAVTERFDEYIGGLFRPGQHPYSDRLRLVNSEGRSYARSHEDRYDIIQMSGVDSFTALSTGAYTLSESYLYTVEAVKEFYEHLNDGGYINYSRILIRTPQPRETLRLANIARQALDEIGVEDPAAQIAVFWGFNWASTMIKRGAFTETEIDALRQFARDEGFVGLLYEPTRRDQSPAELPPFELDARLSRRLLEPWLRDTMPGIGAEQAAELGDSLLRAERKHAQGAGAAVADLARAFSVDEAQAGEMLAAVSTGREVFSGAVDQYRSFFHELLAGTPEQRDAFVASYPFDISPCTDDDPFFFNYYRFTDLFRELPGRTVAFGGFAPNFPVGHTVLLASLVQIVLLALLMIFLPLRRLKRQGVGTRGSWRYFLYFAALGMGFMFVEIVLMQKIVIFLGHPTYAVSVVLAALLTFAGCGSLLSGYVKDLSRRNLLILAAGIAAVILAVCIFLNTAMPALLGLPFGARVATVVAVILPLGLALGMAFPTGMRIVSQNSPQLLPWCWAINGFLSVFSSLFCIVLSMSIGFTAVLVLAALIYIVGFAAMPAPQSSQVA